MGVKQLKEQFKSDFGRAWPLAAILSLFFAGMGWAAFNLLHGLVF